jgi:molybdate transport system ATP-binding protein
MSIEVEIQHRQGDFALDVRFVSDAMVTALFGRSGAGKTSIVNAIGGLVRPERGRIVVAGAVLFDSARRIFVPKHKRRIGYVFQEGRLFPHLTVRHNLFYGRWFAPRASRHAHPDEVLDLLGIRHLLDRRPGSLSGGEKQRVAIGRALLAAPRALLMDEPLAALDDARKAEILPYLERLRDESEIPIVYVSHAVAEVARLAATIVVLADGRVEATGSVADVLGRLDLIRLSEPDDVGEVVEATVTAHSEEFDLTTLAIAGGTLRVPRQDLAIGARARLFIRARDVMIATRRPEGLSALNVLAARIAEIGAAEGPSANLRLDLGGTTLLARLTRQSIHDLGLAPGSAVFAVIKSVTFGRANVGPGGAAAAATPAPRDTAVEA